MTKKLLSRGFLTKKLKWAVVILSAVLLVSFCAASIALRANAASSGDDWPMFHHVAAHTGYSTNSVAPVSPVVVWNYTTDGPIADSPIIAKGIVYFSSWSAFDADYRVYALNASTGILLWNRSYGGYSSTPAVVDGYVYTSGYAYNASTGELLLNYYDNSGNSTHGYTYGYTSPTVDEGRVYFGLLHAKPPYVGGVVAINAKTGIKLWNFTTGAVYAAPTVANGCVYFCNWNHNVYALDAATGAQIWNVAAIGNVYSSPPVANGKVYMSGTDGNVYCLDALTGARIWSYPAFSGPENSPAVANGYVYAGRYAFNASTGAPVWNNTKFGGSSPAVADGVVYDHYYTNNMVPPRTPFTKSTYAFNASTGALIWNYTFPGEYETYLVSSPAIAYGMVFIGAREALYVFGTALSPTPSPSSPLNAPLSTLIVIVAVVVIVTLAVLFLAYKKRRKGAKSSPRIMSPPQP